MRQVSGTLVARNLPHVHPPVAGTRVLLAEPIAQVLGTRVARNLINLSRTRETGFGHARGS